MSTWKRDAASGLIVLVPVLVIGIVVGWLFNNIAGLPVLDRIDSPLARVAIAIVVFVSLVFAVGYLMRTTVGRVFERYLDAAMNRVPLVRVVYNASKLAVETAVSGTDELQAPVRLETWSGVRMTAFKTGQTTADGREVLFLPTAPNITTGFVIEVKPEDIEMTDESVEQALTRILSAGFAEEEDPQVAVDDVVGDTGQSGVETDERGAKPGDGAEASGE